MQLSQKFIDQVQGPYPAIWAANADSQHMPALARSLGVKVEEDRAHIRFYLPLIYGQEVVDNFAINDKLVFLFANVNNNESYQLKGRYCSHWPSSEVEIQFQLAYARGFANVLKEQGLPPENTFRAIYAQPSVGVLMQIEEIYEQTPRQGTGEKVSSDKLPDS
jgi:hypothetical protein